MTITTGWPPQVLLPGQAAAPEGPLDLTMLYVVHHALRRDLAALAVAVRSTPVEDRAGWRRLSGRFDLFSAAWHYHQRACDTGLWSLLAARDERHGRRLAALLAAEHGRAEHVVDSCASAFTRLAEAGDQDALAALVVRLAACRQSLARQLVHAETEALPLVQQLVAPTEWAQVLTEQFAPRHLPMSTLLTVVPWAVSDLPGHARLRLLTAQPWPLRLAWRLGRRSFARRERRTFGRHSR